MTEANSFNLGSIESQYQRDGYVKISDGFDGIELREVVSVVSRFHNCWKQENGKTLLKGAVNSSYLTGTQYLSDLDRSALFWFISSSKIARIISELPFQRAAFMNAQLFFDPVDAKRKNYWHRDPQYHLSIDEQKKVLSGSEVIHIRIPLRNEPGIELIPGTHRRWDSEEELKVRLEQSGKKNHHDISTGVVVPLSKGDALVFSANIIHRGLYGNDRRSFDLLFCEAKPELAQFLRRDCLPDRSILSSLENPLWFQNAIDLKGRD